MRQFDICHLRGKNTLVLILQHDHVDDLATRIVAPLAKLRREDVISRTRLVTELAGTEYLVQIDRMAAVDQREIGPVAGSLIPRQDEIKVGMDVLLFGF